ncbi:hypothetical protein [Glutamicibacter halophytocola]|uniref:Uncharacterized protein n=1 Tax=Glutamicibacter halophytocola TaxID=1933880 RepID=A0A5B8I1R1_9MICC|nr:hypothetical protein [Glutamicibacter halophytocola]QDY66615.1 hypothetical protein FQA45_09930 [Glutamicibacter halophytocola]UUX58730.1 hypothetical protein NUH22_15760 [Glutamicibacter halophytocola]
MPRRILGSSGMNLVPKALFGAFRLSFGERMFAPVQLSVDVVTVCLGGIYLIYLLNRGTYKAGA